MELTLKRAAEAARVALEAANIALTPKASISVHVPDPPAAARHAVGRFDHELERTRELIDAAYAVRAAIGEANARSGLSALLTRRAALEVHERRLRVIVDGVGVTRAEADNLSTLEAAVASARARVAAGHDLSYGGEELPFAIVDAAREDAIRAQRAEFRRERALLADQVAALNLTVRVTLDAETVAVLRGARILD